MSDPNEGKANPQKRGFGVFVKGPAAKAAGTVPGLSKPKDVKKRWMYVGAGIAVVLIVVSSMMRSEPPKRNAAPEKRDEPLIDVTPKDESKKAFEARYGMDLEDVKRRMQVLEQENRAKADELTRLKQEMANKPVSSPSASSDNTGGLSSGVTPPPPKPPASRETPAASVPTVPPGLAIPPIAGGGSTLPVPVPSAMEAPKKPLLFDAPASADDKPDVEAKITYTKNPNAGAFSLGFAPVSLLNGLDAGTSQTTQANPMPVLMNVTDHMILPGLDRYRMKNCFLLGSGYGELSAERVYIRVSRISCVDKSNKLAVTAEVSGVVNDSDGKLGLRGKIVDRQGARLAKTVLAGFAAGLTQALAQGQASVTTSPLTGSTTSTLQGSAMARAAGLTGAQSAANQLAEFYLKEAQSIFPVISIDAGRMATVMFTNTSKLMWQSTDAQFVQSVAPTNSGR